ncbi:hypothetical protein J5U22_00371 [Saccharolobus shibatae]|uniref:Uncharacterized protein n=2 Tax=Saccharolobus shibatae TaxID=2286 RepID=A0A8F5GY89_9CREN|nr:hypothetical protein J5U22_00371 [Saccharolobus shibatae]
MKGLSNVVAAILILITIFTSAIITVTTLQLENAQYVATTYIAQNYYYFHNLVETQLENHILNISYFAFPLSNGDYCIEITFQLNPNVDYSNPYSINITSIIAFNNNGVSLLQIKYPIQILISSSPYTITFKYSSVSDLYVIFQNGVTVFIPPNSSV